METLTLKHELVELSTNELQTINGGDKFLRDVGRAIGYGWTKLMDAYADSMRYNETALSSAM